MPEAHCHPCRARGRTRPATRLVPKTPGSREVIPKCDDCYRLNVPVELTPLEKAQAAEPVGPPFLGSFPPAQPVPEVPMQTPHKKPAQIDWPAVQADRDAGELTILQIAEKYGTSTANVYVRTRPRDKFGAQRKKSLKALKALAKKATAAAAAGLSAEAGEFRYVPLDQVPIRRKPAGINSFWLRLAAALVECPAGQAVPFAVPPFAAKAKNPQGSIRGGLTRALRVNPEANGLRFYIACEKGQAWVWPRQGRAENPSKGKAR